MGGIVSYLLVWRADVADFAQLGYFGFDIVGESDGGEDGEGAGLETH